MRVLQGGSTAALFASSHTADNELVELNPQNAIHKYAYDSPQAELTFSFCFCGSLTPPIAFPRGSFAEACPRLDCNGQPRGSARSAPQRPRAALAAESTTWSPKKSCSVSGLAHRLAAGLVSANVSLGNVFSDLRSPGSAGYPAGAVIVGACAGSGSRTGLEGLPEPTCRPGFIENYYGFRAIDRAFLRSYVCRGAAVQMIRPKIESWRLQGRWPDRGFLLV